MLKDNIGRLRFVGILEGVSCLLLFGVTMPLKYVFDMPQYNYPVGLAHGLLFVLYMLLGIISVIENKWPVKKLLMIFGASLVPFGTFIIDKRLK